MPAIRAGNFLISFLLSMIKYLGKGKHIC
jgi:hypothetical protein